MITTKFGAAADDFAGCLSAARSRLFILLRRGGPDDTYNPVVRRITGNTAPCPPPKASQFDFDYVRNAFLDVCPLVAESPARAAFMPDTTTLHTECL
ncbi:hypothetical protein FA95DRAFT_1553981 [Auriscalpium vulgare]|uniref:Uncharacterized protein n=1 Tax=Auriscalpium vulgare TaxID=40419 RepID=A0ACB8S7V6_9AGAM|nr:hypothetical protein FA95DRAFT_1553981 [Auriscalpium vulgare]